MIKTLKLPNFLRVITDTLSGKSKRVYFPGYSNPDRRQKRAIMRSMNITGKRYRKLQKFLRRDKKMIEGYRSMAHENLKMLKEFEHVDREIW